jgi:hypothetical protein
MNIGLSPQKRPMKESAKLLSVATLLETLAQNEVEREEAQQQPKT